MAAASKLMSMVPTRVLVPAVARQYRFFEPELQHLDELVRRGRGAVDAGVWRVRGRGGWLARFLESTPSNRTPTWSRALTPALPSNVFLHQVALSNRAGESKLWIPSRGMGTEGRASLEASTPTDSNWRQQEVTTSRLDDLDLGNVGFVKIDVEGHELAVLKGAQELLASQRPTILIEIEEHAHSDGQFDAIVAFLLSYRGSYLHKGNWHPIEDLDRRAVHEMANRVAQHGYAVGLLFFARRYIHNFVFRPI